METHSLASLGHNDFGEPRRVHFGEAVREILQRLNRSASGNRFVFTFQGRPVKSIKTAWTSAITKAGIQKIQIRDFRRTFSTNARKARIPEIVIMKLTGHKTLSMFVRYNMVDESDGREAMN